MVLTLGEAEPSQTERPDGKFAFTARSGAGTQQVEVAFGAVFGLYLKHFSSAPVTVDSTATQLDCWIAKSNLE